MLIEELRKAPFLRAIIPLVAGILASRTFQVSMGPAGGILIGSIVVTTAIVIAIQPYPGRFLYPGFSRKSGIVIQLIFFITGLVSHQESGFRADIAGAAFYGRVTADVTENRRTYTTTLDRVWYLRDSVLCPVRSMVQAYLQKDSRCDTLGPGMMIRARGFLDGFEPRTAGDGFDYRAYLAGRGVAFSVYLDSTDWEPVQGIHHSIRTISLTVRRSMISRLDMELPNTDKGEMAILASLLVGYRGDLGPETREQFIRSGSMHILAISGLHVGILYFIPFFLVRKIRRPLLLRIICSILVLLLLWSYALITGMSSSVTRAAGMCSLYEVSRLTGRRTIIIQVMSIAALFMVLMRPAIVFESGFQLSFMAMAGIGMFFRRLSSLLPDRQSELKIKGYRFGFHGRFLKWCWKLTCISFSAQLGTAPLVIFHFGQYPSFSIPGNLIILPMAGAILYCGMLFFCLAWVPALAGGLSGILYHLARGINLVTGTIAGLPCASIGGMDLSSLQVFLLYILILLFYLYLEKRHIKLLMAILTAVILMSSLSSFQMFREPGTGMESKGFLIQNR